MLPRRCDVSDLTVTHRGLPVLAYRVGDSHYCVGQLTGGAEVLTITDVDDLCDTDTSSDGQTLRTRWERCARCGQSLEPALLRVVCAWCGKVLREGVGPVSHGICTVCATKVSAAGAPKGA